jgi:A/G-specific adenine glycosylase
MVMQQLPERLLPWYMENRRMLPWRRDREPYHVWLSEIMLQQTRVEAVRGYYERFLQALPDIAALANAQEDALLKLWEGLGYYSRARNLQKAAKQIMQQYGGAFPQTHAQILDLPGVGAYTAGAIASICFEQPTPAVDGNVLRVVSRLTELSAPISSQRVKNAVNEALAKVYPKGRCGDFTQALMELGATVCVPNTLPHCPRCPMAQLCAANRAGTQRSFPLKEKKKPRRVQARTVFILRCGERLAVCRRPKSGLLAGLWQLPDVDAALDAHEALAQAQDWGVKPSGIEKLLHRTHIFTHVQWEQSGYYMRCDVQDPRFTWVSPQELTQSIGLPTAYRHFLEE